MFVHGGAWRRQSSREQAFPAEPIIAAGAAYVALNFENLPAVTLPEMAAQVRRGIEWVYQSLSKEIVVCGHSSGGHLTACALTQLNFVRKALVVSGIYDLLPVRLSARNDYVRLDERLEHEYSPIRHVQRIRCPVTVAWAEKAVRRVLPSVEGVRRRAGHARPDRHGPQSFRDCRNACRSTLTARARCA